MITYEDLARAIQAMTEEQRKMPAFISHGEDFDIVPLDKIEIASEMDVKVYYQVIAGYLNEDHPVMVTGI